MGKIGGEKRGTPGRGRDRVVRWDMMTALRKGKRGVGQGAERRQEEVGEGKVEASHQKMGTGREEEAGRMTGRRKVKHFFRN